MTGEEPSGTVHVVYVLRNPAGRLYIGYTTDLERRLAQHASDEGGWTRGRGPWELVHHEVFPSRLEALRRERSLKRGRQHQELRAQLARELDGRAGPSGTEG